VIEKLDNGLDKVEEVVVRKGIIPTLTFGTVIKYIERYMIYLVLVLMMILLSFLSPHFLTLSNILNVARQISIGAIVAFGMMVPLLAGEFDISVGSNMALSSALVIGLMGRGGVYLAFLVALGAGLLIGLVNGLFNTKGKIPSFIVTLSTMGIVRGLVFLYTKGNSSMVAENAPDLFFVLGKGYIGPIPFPVIVMLVIFSICAFVLFWTKFGRHIYSIGGNRKAAHLFGINVDRHIIYAFMVSGFLSAFSGIMLASRLSSTQPTAGTGAEFDALAAIVIGGTKLSGGKGSIARTLVGVFVIGLINNGINLLDIETFYHTIIKGAIILFAVLFDQLRERR
jgi:ribose transport system permease protein